MSVPKNQPAVGKITVEQQVDKLYIYDFKHNK